jgi:hypothetical protein
VRLARAARDARGWCPPCGVANRTATLRAVRRGLFSYLLGGLAVIGLAIGAAREAYTASGTGDPSLPLWAAAAYVVVNLLTLALAAFLVAAGRRRFRSDGVVIGVSAIVVVAALFPVNRKWLDAEYVHGTVPLAQSLLMRPVPGAAIAVGEPTAGPPAFAYSQ